MFSFVRIVITWCATPPLPTTTMRRTSWEVSVQQAKVISFPLVNPSCRTSCHQSGYINIQRVRVTRQQRLSRRRTPSTNQPMTSLCDVDARCQDSDCALDACVTWRCEDSLLCVSSRVEYLCLASRLLGYISLGWGRCSEQLRRLTVC